MQENNNRTELSALGEFGLIKHLTKEIKSQNISTVKGIGDDAAVLQYPNNQIVMTTDLLVEGIHFDLMYMPLKHLGYKSVMVNLSDVFAMNAQPRQITVSIAVSQKLAIEDIDELYEGIKLACEKFNVDLVGGDTTSSKTGLLISITAIGEAQPEKITYRDTAKPSDLICVSGDLGGAYMGLQLLEREKKVFEETNIQPDFTGHDYILSRQMKPEARGDIIQILEDAQVQPTAMIDISDGLASEIMHICEKSNTGCKILEDKIPVSEDTKKMAKEINIDHTTAAMNGGEDYELLFTIDVNDYDRIKFCDEISVIGHITEQREGLNLVAQDGTHIQIMAQGWNALK